MEAPDRRALELAGGPDIELSIIPAAAAPDNNHERAGKNGVRWFRTLGATNVAALPLIDRTSADDPMVIERLRGSRLIYMLGGFPKHLAQTLEASPSWEAMLKAQEGGAVIAGSSAGAMVLCEYYYDPPEAEVIRGLNLLPGICVLPHHDTFGRDWAAHLAERLSGITLVGIDEQTGILNDGPQGRWQIYGKGMVTLYRRDQIVSFRTGEPFSI
jgi:cyanophycinase